MEPKFSEHRFPMPVALARWTGQTIRITLTSPDNPLEETLERVEAAGVLTSDDNDEFWFYPWRSILAIKCGRLPDSD